MEFGQRKESLHHQCRKVRNNTASALKVWLLIALLIYLLCLSFPVKLITFCCSRCRNGWGVGDVQWSPSGSCYAVFMATHAEVYSVATAGVTHTITCSNRVCSIAFLEVGIESFSGSFAVFLYYIVYFNFSLG